MAGDGDLVLGKLALKNKYMSEAQLQEALRAQRDLAEVGCEMALGTILLERGYLTQEKLDILLRLQQFTELREEDKRFGQLAVKNGFVTVEQVQECLNIQLELFNRGVKAVSRIGDLLADKGFISEQQKGALLKTQSRLKAPPP
ncbi:MAG: hypothetical protein RDV41_15400, partial [Planctomycetota bacterium]|nr:hypothetical protein [Planctomycetota bacterium]